MHTLPYEIDCTACGCPEVDVQREPKPDAWFADGIAQCSECGQTFAFRAPPPGPAEERQPAAVIYAPVRCPECGTKKCGVTHSALPVRYHRCERGHTFKSVEKRS